MTTPNAPFALGGATPNYTFPLPLSTTDPDEEPLVYVRLNQEWLKYLIGAVYYLRQEASWASTDYSLVCLSIARANMLADMLMTLLCDPVCIEGIRLAGNTLQVSTDGGETWSNLDNAGSEGNPQDPRTSEPLKPARTGSNVQCLSAANATAVFVELHRELSAWYNTLPSVLNLIYSIGAGLQQFFAALWQNFGLAVDVDTLAVDILAHSASLNDAAFTSAIQDRLTCILYCRADNNGRWSAGAIELVMSDIAAETGDMWRLLEVYLEQVAGYAGLNNAGTTTSVSSDDCSSCGCGWCYKFDFTASDGGWVDEGDGHYSAGQGWVADSGSDVFWDCYTKYHFSTGQTITHVRFKANVGALHGSAPTGTSYGIYIKHGGTTTKVTSMTPVYGAEVTLEWTGTLTSVTDIWMDWNTGNYDEQSKWAEVTCFEALLEGSGSNPIGTDNCI